MSLYFEEEHEALRAPGWDAERALQVIREICIETDEAFDPDLFWPEHPSDSDWSPGMPMTSLFRGAASNAWALLWLREENAIPGLRRNYETALDRIHACYLRQPDSETVAPGYLFGETGLLTVRYRFAPAPHVADLLYAKARETVLRPENELMWAAPGAIVAARFMLDRTGEGRWRALVLEAAEHLLNLWEYVPEIGARIWTQNLYGKIRRYLGAVHGFSGNVFSLLLALPELSPEKQEWILSESVETLRKTARREHSLANWPPLLESSGEEMLVQWCHGAPGMITAFSRAPKFQALEELLVAAGELIWKAGPLKKPFGLCHGTAGNGFAFLKQFRRTDERVWLERARAFAMHAIEQSEAQRTKLGRRRYGLYTGDLGLACFLWNCVKETDEWPLLDRI